WGCCGRKPRYRCGPSALLRPQPIHDTMRTMSQINERRSAPATSFNRFLGGTPLGVLARLILLSVLVGVILSAIGLDPADILHSLERLVRTIWDMGFDAVRWAWRYFLLGAVVVVPIWFIVRLARAQRGQS